MLHYISDTDGCFMMRVKIPFDALKAYGVYNSNYCFLPSDPSMEQMDVLMGMIREFDIVIVQRCYLLPLVERIKTVCEFLGKPLVFEVDDDYASLEPHNPAYYALVEDQELFKKYKAISDSAQAAIYQGDQEKSQELIDQAKELVPALEASRKIGLENYKKLLSIVDFVTVSTEELKRTIYPYNKNVFVFENNIDRVFPWNDGLPINMCMKDVDGKQVIEIPNTLNLFQVPNHHIKDDGGIDPIVRVGYTGTESHRGDDFETIRSALDYFMETNKTGYFITFLGDPWFYQQLKDKSRVFSLPGDGYDKYMYNVRNIDVMLCPLSPNIFNMSKSDIKLVEAGAWGNPGLAPRFITYSRNWIEEENCLMYGSPEEFVHQLERLVKDHSLRKRLGRAALEYVANFRLELHHSKKRFEFYMNCVKSKKPLVIHEMEKAC